MTAPPPTDGACPRCGLAGAAGGNFCTGCGADLRRAGMRPEGEGKRRTPAHPVGSGATRSDVGILACPGCGSVNAASRRRCGRCGLDLHRQPGDPGSVPAAAPAPRSSDGRRATREGSRALLAATAVVALAIVVIASSLLYQRGSAGDGPEAVGEPVEQRVATARASSSLPPAGSTTHGPGNLIDGDPASAWNEAGEGSGTGQWVALELVEPAQIARLLVWNGHQKGALFNENARVRDVRIELGGESFTATLLDTRGPQAVDLPEPVPADEIRLTIEAVYPGTRYDDAALSEVRLLGLPASADAEPAGDPGS